MRSNTQWEQLITIPMRRLQAKFSICSIDQCGAKIHFNQLVAWIIHLGSCLEYNQMGCVWWALVEKGLEGRGTILISPTCSIFVVSCLNSIFNVVLLYNCLNLGFNTNVIVEIMIDPLMSHTWLKINILHISSQQSRGCYLYTNFRFGSAVKKGSSKKQQLLR